MEKSMEHSQSGKDADIEIKQFLKRVIRRDCQQTALRMLGIYGLAGSILCFILQFITLCIPFYYGGILGGILLLLSLLAGGIHVLCRLAGERTAARLADKAGLEERVSTSLEGRGKDDSFWVLQRIDTCEKIRQFSLPERLPFVLPWKKYVLTGTMLLLAGICYLFPAPVKDEAKRRHEFAKKVADATEKMDEVKEKLKEQEKSGKLSKENLKKIERAMDTALEEIKQADNKEGISAAKERLETKLLRDLPEDISKETAESLQPFVEEKNLASLAQYQQQLAELAKSNEAVAAAMDELKDLGEQLSSQEQKSLLDELSKLAGDGTLSNQEITSALQKLQNANAEYASISIQNNSQNGEGQNGQGMQGEQGSNGQSGDGQQQGNNGDGNGQDGGQQGAGGQSEGGGQNAGSSQGNGGGMNRGSKQGMEREDKTKEAETVWIPDETGDDENLTGQKTGTSKNRKKTSNGPARAGQKADLSSVSGQYRQKAYSKLDKQKVPESKEDLVKKYFSGLE